MDFRASKVSLRSIHHEKDHSASGDRRRIANLIDHSQYGPEKVLSIFANQSAKSCVAGTHNPSLPIHSNHSNELTQENRQRY